MLFMLFVMLCMYVFAKLIVKEKLQHLLRDGSFLCIIVTWFSSDISLTLVASIIWSGVGCDMVTYAPLLKYQHSGWYSRPHLFLTYHEPKYNKIKVYEDLTISRFSHLDFCEIMTLNVHIFFKKNVKMTQLISISMRFGCVVSRRVTD